jgi:hypothetical protein
MAQQHEQRVAWRVRNAESTRLCNQLATIAALHTRGAMHTLEPRHNTAIGSSGNGATQLARLASMR